MGTPLRISPSGEAACLGEEVFIAKNGVPVARLMPVAGLVKKRVLGRARGMVAMSADFDAPMSEAELNEFLGL